MSTKPSIGRIWLKAIRPATLFACVSPIVVGTALAFESGQVRWWTAGVALVASGLIQIGTNLHNDYEDFIKGADTDERLGPERAAAKGWLTPRQVAWGAAVAMGLSVLAGLSLVNVGGWPILVVGVLSVLAGLAYTGGPFPLAYLGLGDLFVLIFFGFVAVLGTYYLHTDTLSAAAWLMGAAVGLMNTAILVVNNLRDRHTDAKANKRTLAVRFGASAARAEYLATITLPYGLVGMAVMVAGGSPTWLMVLLSAPLAIREARAVLSKDGAALNPHLGGAARLGLIFSLLFAAGALI